MKENNERLSSKNERQRIVEWGRSKVLELSSQGNSQPEISRTLQISLGTVNKDLSYLRQQAQENLQRYIQQKPPEEYQRCLTGINQVLKLSWNIANESKNDNSNQTIKTTTDDKTRLGLLLGSPISAMQALPSEEA